MGQIQFKKWSPYKILNFQDILKQGLLRELNMRQKEQDRKLVMENNKKFLNDIGR